MSPPVDAAADMGPGWARRLRALDRLIATLGEIDTYEPEAYAARLADALDEYYAAMGLEGFL